MYTLLVYAHYAYPRTPQILAIYLRGQSRGTEVGAVSRYTKGERTGVRAVHTQVRRRWVVALAPYPAPHKTLGR